MVLQKWVAYVNKYDHSLAENNSIAQIDHPFLKINIGQKLKVVTHPCWLVCMERSQCFVKVATTRNNLENDWALVCLKMRSLSNAKCKRSFNAPSSRSSRERGG